MANNSSFAGNSTTISEITKATEWDLSEYVYNLTNILVFNIFGTLLSSVGIFGNMCTVLVLWRKKDKSKITIFIMALAMADVAALFFFFLFCIFRISSSLNDTISHNSFLTSNYYYITYIMRVPKSITSTLTVVISIERLVSIANPGASRASGLYSKKFAISLCAAIAITTCILFLPFALEFSHKTVYLENIDRYRVFTTFSSFGQNREFFLVYYIIINVICTILAVVITLICNIILVLFLIKRSKVTIGTSQKSVSKREISTTKTLLTISFVFVICITPAAVYYPVKALNIFKRETLFNRVLFAWINFLELLNHFANPPLFYITSLEFRNAYKNLFRKTHVAPMETTSERGPSTQTQKF